MQAARNDDAEAIGRALRAGVDPNTKDGETGRTLAIEAARHGAVNALALLLAATEGAEEQRTESSVTARGGDGGWFVHAQKWESPLWQYSDDGWSPLMHAVSCGQLACARMLVEAGADVYLTDYDGVDAVRLAVATPGAQLTREMLTLLIERGGFVAGGADDDTGEHALLHAARNANAAACDVLLRAGTGPAKLNKPNKDGESALLLASRAGGADAVRTMLAFAVERRDVVQCKLLTEHKTGDNAIHAAVRARAVDCASGSSCARSWMCARQRTPRSCAAFLPRRSPGRTARNAKHRESSRRRWRPRAAPTRSARAKRRRRWRRRRPVLRTCK